MKICSKCKTEKPLTDFGKHTRSKDGLNCYCKICAYESVRRRLSTPEGRAAAHESLLRWRAIPENREASCEAVRRRRATPEGREVHRKSILNYAKNHPNGQYARLKNDPLYKLATNIRNLVYISIKNQGFSKTTRTATILGCSFEEFKAHIEKQFTNGMCWNNQGKWHFDHIKPISLAKTEAEVLALNHYTNFQPLWAADNIRKSNKYLTNFD